MLRITAFIALFFVTAALAADEERPLILDQSQEYSLRLTAFCDKHGDDLAAILQHKDKSLLLGAYWRYLNHPKRLGECVDLQDVRKLRNEFIGALTALTGNEPPQWWQNSLMEERLVFHPASTELFNDFWEEGEYGAEFRQRTWHPDAGTLGPQTKIAAVTDTELQFETPTGKILLNAKARTKLLQLQSGRNLAAIGGRSGSRNYLFLFAPILPNHCYLLQFDDEGNLQWTQDVWCHGLQPTDRDEDFFEDETTPLYGKGPWNRRDRYHYAEFIAVNDFVVVYGAGHAGAYVEAFDTKAGTPVFRFSTHAAHPAYVVPAKVPPKVRARFAE